MGSTSSKFKKYLQHGDEFAAMQIYQSSPELRKNLDPNLSYGENHSHNTALHYAAKHGMKHLLRTFLNDLGGNPNKKNALNETVLHCACQLNQTKSFSAQERRAACVQLLLYWKGVLLPNGTREKIDLATVDKEGNTALHYAALNGLKRCVELLITHSAPLFVENADKMTPCDLAMRNFYHDIARLLESRMVFADNSDIVNEDEITNEQEEIYSGLRSQDLQEAKDQLLVDTSDMLKIPLFTAEALLRDNEWSRELLLEKWMKNPIECCQSAGVQAPCTILQRAGSLESNISTIEAEEIVCEICLMAIQNHEQLVKISCKHLFCKSCWQSYLTTKIQDGDAHHILCPAYQCHILVPVELIEKLVSPDMARRYLQFDIKAFVESNKCIKWCPIAGCGRAVKLPISEQYNNKIHPITSHAVDCGNAHFFCWECLGEAHAPCGCKQWQEWQLKIAEIRPEELQASCSGSEDAANCLWLVTNSKPCPNCRSPIQKNEGCNHMKCSKCKFDFCWVCQESWKRHSSATGGYFRCNRFEAVNKADEKQDNLISEALDRNNQMQEMSRFLHFYTRFKNHENSQKLEEPLLNSVRQKMEVLANCLGLKINTKEKSTKFIEEGVRELLKARRVLCGSYIYGYYLQDDGYNKTIFEFMQNELEEVTEKLSEMIARPYLRTPKAVIIQTTSLTRRKRHEFVKAVSQGLIPPETPPNHRKRKRKFEVDPSQVWLEECNSEKECPNHKNQNDCGLLCSRRGSDYNMELIIALEMSRLQMIEDKMKQAETKASQEVASNSENDDQLKLAIQLSLEESAQKDADLTVDCFLKSLAKHKIDLKSLDLKSDLHFRPYNNNGNEDGRFQISDIHEKDFAFEDLDEFEDGKGLKRSHSTGDLCIKRSSRGIKTRICGDEPRYHLDSDHSSQHDDKPEDLKILPSIRTKQLLLHREETFHGQSSLEDNTISDSINADLEVYGILNPSEKSINESAQIIMPQTKIAINKSLELLSDSNNCDTLSNNRVVVNGECKSEKQSPKNIKKKRINFSKSTGYLVDKSTNLQVKINTKLKTLETDSSNEYESETGIPKSPTLFISGVSISRTPEPKSPGIFLLSGRQSRSSSLSVPVPLNCSINHNSSNSLNAEPFTPSLMRTPSVSRSTTPNISPSHQNNIKSKSANEPEREREMFRFPKSSTDGALSSVLHIQESNLSSDDFHEALFLRSPKTRDSKRRKKSKKKDKDEKKEDVSSAL